jgi:hypothetical protein
MPNNTQRKRRRKRASAIAQRRLPLDAPSHPREEYRLQGSMSAESLFDFLVRRMIAQLPEDKREAAWLAWKNSERGAP